MGWLKLLALPALMLLGFYMIDSRAEQRGRDAALVLQNQQKQMVRDLANAVEGKLKADTAVRDQVLFDKLSAIRSVDKMTLIKEIHSDPRFSDPDLGITDGMFDALNSARSLSRTDAPVSGGESPLPRAALSEGQEH